MSCRRRRDRVHSARVIASRGDRRFSSSYRTVLPAITGRASRLRGPTCQNRLREIALGCLKYASLEGSLAAGTDRPAARSRNTDSYWPGSGTAENDSHSRLPYVGVLAIILPHVDQIATYERIKRLCWPGLEFRRRCIAHRPSVVRAAGGIVSAGAYCRRQSRLRSISALRRRYSARLCVRGSTSARWAAPSAGTPATRKTPMCHFASVGRRITTGRRSFRISADRITSASPARAPERRG